MWVSPARNARQLTRRLLLRRRRPSSGRELGEAMTFGPHQRTFFAPERASGESAGLPPGEIDKTNVFLRVGFAHTFEFFGTIV
jgi:hypothetical protein